MTFMDTLRTARSSRVSVLHEFWTQYDPNKRRVHAFFEGHEDFSFFSRQIEVRLPKDYKLVSHRCDGKPRVYDALQGITSRLPDIQSVLFFVDKDLDDILGTPWPTDPRVYVTDLYSIESYLASVEVLEKLCRAAVRLNAVNFNDTAILGHFRQQLGRFQKQLLCVMAWILVVRRQGGRPNLRDIDLRRICKISPSGEPQPITGARARHIGEATGARVTGSVLAHVGAASRELARVSPKRVMRGKFELWFFVEYWKCLVVHLRTLAKEVGGRVSFSVNLDHANAVMILSALVSTPEQLERFLAAHLSRLAFAGAIGKARGEKKSWLRRVVDRLWTR